MNWIALALLTGLLLAAAAAGGDPMEALFTSEPFTPEKSFTEGIEGPALPP